MYVYSDSLSLNLLKYWTNNNVTGIGNSSSDGMQHSELQYSTVNEQAQPHYPANSFFV